MNEYSRLRRRLRTAMATPDTLTCAAGPLADILDETLGAMARGLDPRLTEAVHQVLDEEKAMGEVMAAVLGPNPAPRQAGDEVTRAAAEIDRLARAGTPCLVVGAPYAQAIEALEALGWIWWPHQGQMVRAGATPIRVAWTSAAIRGPNCGALWLAGATAEQATEASKALRREPKTTITTGMVDRSDPAGVSPVIRETDKTDSPCAACDAAALHNASTEPGPMAYAAQCAQHGPDAAPVLPPGCRLEVLNGDRRGERWTVVVDRQGRWRGHAAAATDAAEQAWGAFGSFMSREDYEGMAREAGRAMIDRRKAERFDGLSWQDVSAHLDKMAAALGITGVWHLRDVVAACEALANVPGQGLSRRVRALTAERDGAREALREAGVDVRCTLAEGVQMLLAKVGKNATEERELRLQAWEDAERALDAAAAERDQARADLERVHAEAKAQADLILDMIAEAQRLRERERLAKESRGRAQADELVARQRLANLGDQYNAERAKRQAMGAWIDAAKAALRRAGIDGTDLAERIDALAAQRDNAREGMEIAESKRVGLTATIGEIRATVGARDDEHVVAAVRRMRDARDALDGKIGDAREALRRDGIDGFEDLVRKYDAAKAQLDQERRLRERSGRAIKEAHQAMDEAGVTRAHVSGLAGRVRLLASNWTAARAEAARTAGERDKARAERDKAWATARRAAAMLPPIKIIRSPEPGVRERVEFPDGSVCVERETPNTLSWEVTPPYPAESMAAEWSHERRRRWDQALAALAQSRDRAPAMLLEPEDPDHD